MEAKLNAPVYDGYNLIYYLKQGQGIIKAPISFDFPIVSHM